jgi:hypothetical protein
MRSKGTINTDYYSEGPLFTFKRSILLAKVFAAVLSRNPEIGNTQPLKSTHELSHLHVQLSIIHHRPSSTFHLCNIASSLLSSPEYQTTNPVALRGPCGKMANEASVALTNRALRTIKTVRPLLLHSF